MGRVLTTWKRLAEWKRFLIIFLTPLLLSPIPLTIETKEARTAFAILIMGVYWCTEVTDLAVTSLLPLLLFPVLKVIPAKEIAPKYFADTNILLIGGLLMAVAIERWNVHKRIALKVLLIVGAQPRRLMLGFMLVTAFISMWITNTATTAMMTPIMEAVLKELDKEYIGDPEEEDNENPNDGNLEQNAKMSEKEKEIKEIEAEPQRESGITNEEVELRDLGLSEGPSRSSSTRVLFSKSVESLDDSLKKEEPEDPKKKRYVQMSKAMMLSVCYAANIGGTGTLTGTAPQLVLAGQLKNVFPKGPGISFLDWFIFACPEMIIFLLLAWLYLQFMFFGVGWKHLCFCFRGEKRNKTKGVQIHALIKQQYKDLGPISFAERAVLAHFLLLVLFWILREPKFIPGWGSAFEVSGKSYVSDATASILIGFSMFLFPSVRPEMFGGPRSKKPHVPLLEWKPTQRKFPWNVILLLGSGFALAYACEKSGLSLWIGCQLTVLGSVSNFAIALCISVLLTFLTEFTSNTATATILLPILASLAQSIRVHPYYLMIPATVCSSFAFMLPVATPPNAIVFATGRLKIPDMMKAGFGMNIIGILVVTLSINTIGLGYFGLNSFPDWASSGNSTDKCHAGQNAIATTMAAVLTTVNTTSRMF